MALLKKNAMFIGNKNILSSILFFLSFFLMLFGCKRKNNDPKIIEELKNSIDRSNYSINISSATILESLKDKTTDWTTKERAAIWFAKATQLDKFSSTVYDYLELLKKTTQLSSEKATELASRLMNFRRNVLNIDSSIYLEFEKKIPIAIDTNNFYSNYFKNSNPLITRSILTKFQNDVSVARNKIIAFCHAQVGVAGWTHPWYSVLVGQSSSYVKPGEEIKLTAGVGYFSKLSSPVINVDGKNILLEEEGFAQYNFKSSKRPGEYTIPVVVDYTDPDTGKKVTQRIYVEYTVAKPCN